MERGKSIIKSFDALVTARQPLETVWRECFNYTYAYRGQGFGTQQQDGIANAQAARTVAANKLDSTMTDSVRLLSSSVLSALTPPHQQWFSLAIANTSDDYVPYDARKWLEDAARTLFESIHASNYDAQALEFFTDVMVGGMAGLYVEKVQGRFKFEVWSLATLYCQEVLGNGFIDTIYRLVKFSPAEAIKKFGINRVPDFIKEEYARDPYSSKSFDFVHTIRPRLDGNGNQVKGGKINRKLPYESVYVCKKSGMVTLESGYHEMPVIVPRWMRIPDTDYAYGPVNDALPDAKTLNEVVRIMMENAEMAISGMFVVRDDGSLNANTARIGPRRIWAVHDPQSVKPLTTGGDINFAVNEIGRLQGQIRRTLLADQLGPSEKVNMTATEITTRTNMIRQILGPIFGRLQAEYLVPLITRCFGLAMRDGDFGQPPQSLADVSFNIAYRSPLARAQKQQQLEAQAQFEQHIAMLIKEGIADQSVIDLYKIDDAARRAADLYGVDVALMRDVTDLEQFRKQRQEQAAQVQAAQAAMQAPPQPDTTPIMPFGEAA